MIEFWKILEITLAVSLCGTLLLAVKWLFRDKLDARWHYFIWSVLLLRLLIPAEQQVLRISFSLDSVIPLPSLLRFIRNRIQGRGWNGLWEKRLLWIYMAGVALLLIYYGGAYLWLRIRVRQGRPANPELQEQVQQIAESFGVRTCRRIRICSWAASPFVTGVFRPVLVLPENFKGSLSSGQDGEELLEDVILHELLHMWYGDVAVNGLLHGIRILNWFNPLIWYMVEQIENDNEALCDQRVLERLERSRHKGYGMLLLEMADTGKVPSVGTSNMANGRRNIRIRLKRIVDFGHVPKGNTLISLCIALLLTLACVGYAPREASFHVGTLQTEAQWKSMFLRASLYEVSTPQEALYIYMRALQERNLGYMALVIPEEQRKAYEEWALQAWREGELYEEYLQPLEEENENVYFSPMPEGGAYLEVLGFAQGETQCTARLGVVSILQQGEKRRDYELILGIQKEYGWKISVLEKRNLKEEQALENFTVLGGIPGFEEAGENQIPGETREWQGEQFQVRARRYYTWGFSTLRSGEFYFPEDGAEFEREFTEGMEWKRIELSYTGKEELTGKLLEVQYGPEELLTEERRSRAPGYGPGTMVEGSDGISSGAMVIPGDWDGTFQTGFGRGGVWKKMEDWKEMKRFSGWICIYIDGQLTEEFFWEGGEGQ